MSRTETQDDGEERAYVDGDNVKVMEIRGVYLGLDEDDVELATSDLPVRGDDGDLCGAASVYLTEGGNYVADVFLDAQTPWRLDIETGCTVYLTPVCGKAFEGFELSLVPSDGSVDLSERIEVSGA